MKCPPIWQPNIKKSRNADSSHKHAVFILTRINYHRREVQTTCPRNYTCNSHHKKRTSVWNEGVSKKRLFNKRSLTLSVLVCFGVCQNFGVCVRNLKTIFQSNPSKLISKYLEEKLLQKNLPIKYELHTGFWLKECSTQMPARCAGLFTSFVDDFPNSASFVDDFPKSQFRVWVNMGKPVRVRQGERDRPRQASICVW